MRKKVKSALRQIRRTTGMPEGHKEAFVALIQLAEGLLEEIRGLRSDLQEDVAE